MSAASRASMPGRSSPILPRWYRSARKARLVTPAWARTIADHREGAGAGDQRRARAVVGVQRLDDHGRARRRGGPGGQREVLRGQFVLLALGQAVRAVPVQRVEDGAAGPRRRCPRRRRCCPGTPPNPPAATAARGRRPPCRPRRSSARRAAPPRGERPGEGVDLVVPGHRIGKRPPELHRVEPGRPCGRGPLQQRQLGEQDRAVDVKPQSVCAHSRRQSLTSLSPVLVSSRSQSTSRTCSQGPDSAVVRMIILLPFISQSP